MANPLSYRIGYANQPQLPLDRVAQLGIKWVEVDLATGQTAAEVLSLLEPHGLRVATLTAFLTLADEGLMEQVATAADNGQALGALGLFAVMHSGGVPLETAHVLVRQMCDIAAARGLFVAIETHPDLCENGTKAAAILAAVNHPAFGWNLDTANIYYYNQGTDTVTEARKAASHVLSVHAKDTDGGFESPRFPNLGEGVVDFAGVGAVLREAGFTGPYTLELEGLAGSADSVERMEANVVACAGHLRGLGLVD